jgi:bacterioferritin-associated ferredoxin
VAAVVDANPLSAWLSRLPEMAARPDLLARGIGWAFALRRAGVPVFHGHALRAIGGSTDVEGVLIGPIDRRWRPAEGPARTLAVDGVCLGFGLLPATDVTRLLGAAHSYRPGLGGWVPDLDENMETSVSGLFVAGDAGGVRGADAAPFSGELAAIGAARRLGRGVGEEKQQGTLLRSWRRAARFGAAMSSLAMPPPEAEALIPDEATVCRCECLSRAVLDRAIEAGSRTLADLKAATRCGMGPCGGKVCMEAAAMLVAAATGASREALGQPSARPPLRPVPLDAIAGSFDYDDLPIPAPAPL